MPSEDEAERRKEPKPAPAAPEVTPDEEAPEDKAYKEEVLVKEDDLVEELDDDGRLGV